MGLSGGLGALGGPNRPIWAYLGGSGDPKRACFGTPFWAPPWQGCPARSPKTGLRRPVLGVQKRSKRGHFGVILGLQRPKKGCFEARQGVKSDIPAKRAKEGQMGHLSPEPAFLASSGGVPGPVWPRDPQKAQNDPFWAGGGWESTLTPLFDPFWAIWAPEPMWPGGPKWAKCPLGDPRGVPPMSPCGPIWLHWVRGSDQHPQSVHMAQKGLWKIHTSPWGHMGP